MQRGRIVAMWISMATLAGAARAADGLELERVTGAIVPEDRATAVLHVNNRSAAAADENAGTEDKPLRTLTRAMALVDENNIKNIGTRVLVHPGLYRESIALAFLGEKATDAPVVIEATVKGKAVVSGSDVWDGWTRHEDTRIYTHAWPHKWGMAPYPHIWEQFVVLTPITRRREMVFVDGKKLTQVLSPVELAPGTFFASEEKETIYLYAPEGVDIGEAVVEVAIRPSVMNISGRTHVAVRGLVFQHGNQWVQGGSAGFGNCTHALIEDCDSVWNNWGGFGFAGCRNVTARRNRINHNGGPGLTAWKVANMLWEDNVTSSNNWRGIKGNFTGWAQGGVKILHLHDAIIRRHRSVSNQTRGFWFDSDCANILVDEAYWVDNLTDGIFFEAVQGPIVVRNSVIAFNRRGPGVICTNSGRIALENNILYGNGGAQIRITGSAEREVFDFVTNEKFMQRTERWTLTDNVLASSDSSQLLLVSPGWDHFMNTLKSERNLWRQPEMATPFQLAGMSLDFEGWQNTTGQDLNSLFGEPGLAAPDQRDFAWRKDSPLHRRADWAARTVPEGAAGGLKALKLREIETNRKTTYPSLAGVEATRWHPIDFSAVANRPLGGEGVSIPNLPHLAPGPQDIHGVRFTVADPAANENHAALGFYSWRAPTWEDKPLPSEAVIPVGRKAQAIYLLQGCAWAPEHRTVAVVQVVYEDGTRSELEIVSYGLASEHLDVAEERRLKSNLSDWWHDFPQFEGPRGRKVIVSDPNDPTNDIRYLYTAEWVNPHPDKTIREMVFRLSDPKHETALTIFAISALGDK